MKITLAKHGGLAAGVYRALPPLLVDTDALLPATVTDLAKLVAAAKAAPPIKEEIPGRSRDAMSYTITIEDDGQSTTLHQSDTNMSQAFATLLTWLERYGEQSQKDPRRS
jgi:Emfourin